MAFLGRTATDQRCIRSMIQKALRSRSERGRRFFGKVMLEQQANATPRFTIINYHFALARGLFKACPIKTCRILAARRRRPQCKEHANAGLQPDSRSR